MKTTTDTYNGSRFRWNTTVLAEDAEGILVNVPARMTNRTCESLAPDRVLPKLLAELNPGKGRAA